MIIDADTIVTVNAYLDRYVGRKSWSEMGPMQANGASTVCYMDKVG